MFQFQRTCHWNDGDVLNSSRETGNRAYSWLSAIGLVIFNFW